MDQLRKKRFNWRRLGRIVAKSVLIVIALFLLVVLLIQTPPVQNLIRNKAVAYLEKKLQTKVSVGHIHIGLPKNIVLENIYIEDRQKDTLLSGGKVKANLNILKLLFNNELDIKSVVFENLTAKIKRQLPDFNSLSMHSHQPAVQRIPHPHPMLSRVLSSIMSACNTRTWYPEVIWKGFWNILKQGWMYSILKNCILICLLQRSAG
jgi:hypothetical protein